MQMMGQQEKGSLGQLRQFLEQIAKESDPYWQTILQSDIRNILPKHEVSKIELVKNSLSKTRLIMQNLNTFISLQVQKKHLQQQMLDLNQNISCELQELMNEKKSPPNREHFHYETSVNRRKKQLQTIARQLSKSKQSNELKLVMEKNEKWQQYIQKHVKQLQTVEESDIHEDMVNFVDTYLALFETSASQHPTIDRPCNQTLSQVILESGAYTKLYQNKLREKILIQKLLDDIYPEEQKSNSTDQDQYWQQQVHTLKKIYDL